MTMPSQFRSVVEAQIRAAYERGDFDDLRGAGKPIPGLMEPEDPMWWVKGMMKREGLSADPLLPPGPLLKREVERLPATVAGLRSEAAVRDLVADLNLRIRRWIQIPVGPQVAIREVDPEEVVAFWHDTRRPAPPPRPPLAGPAAPRRRWLRRWRSS